MIKNKYISDCLALEDLDVKTYKNWASDVWVVSIKHIPTGHTTTSEHESQLTAYNECLKKLELKVWK